MCAAVRVPAGVMRGASFSDVMQTECSDTAGAFYGWRVANLAWPRSELEGEPALPVARPETWLLREGWKKHGPISAFEIPGPRPRARAAA